LPPETTLRTGLEPEDLLALVRAGARFERGILVERESAAAA
jgi:hypothetical protein